MSNPSPPAFDRRSRPVFHKLHEGRVEVSAIAYSIPEALAIEAAIKSTPPADAFVPAEAHAEPPTVPEGHPALADAEDTTEGLNAQTQAVVP